jgi:hypothetical protein
VEVLHEEGRGKVREAEVEKQRRERVPGFMREKKSSPDGTSGCALGTMVDRVWATVWEKVGKVGSVEVVAALTELAMETGRVLDAEGGQLLPTLKKIGGYFVANHLDREVVGDHCRQSPGCPDLERLLETIESGVWQEVEST